MVELSVCMKSSTGKPRPAWSGPRSKISVRAFLNAVVMSIEAVMLWFLVLEPLDESFLRALTLGSMGIQTVAAD